VGSWERHRINMSLWTWCCYLRAKWWTPADEHQST